MLSDCCDCMRKIQVSITKAGFACNTTGRLEPQRHEGHKERYFLIPAFVTFVSSWYKIFCSFQCIMGKSLTRAFPATQKEELNHKGTKGTRKDIS